VDGVLLEPLAALPLGCSVELELEDAPPDAGALVEGAALDDELEEPDGCLLASIVSEFEVELDGGVAGVVEPDAEELELGGVAGVVEPDEEEEALPGGVVRDTVSPSLSQPVSNPAPSARDTATARVESLM
jgi:hypothetical protein